MEVYICKLNHSGSMFELLKISDNGDMTIEFHGSDRVITYNDIELVNEESGVWLRYANNGCMAPWKKNDGTLFDKWQMVDCYEEEQKESMDTTQLSQEVAQESEREAEQSPTPQTSEEPAESKGMPQPAIPTDDEPEVIRDEQPGASALKTIIVELSVVAVCFLMFWYSLCHASFMGAAFSVAILAVASKLGYTPIIASVAE